MNIIGTERHNIDAFLAWARSRGYSTETLLRYDYSLRKFMRFLDTCGSKRLQDVTRNDMDAFQRYLEEQGLSPASLGTMMQTIRKFFRWLTAACRIFTDPTVNLVIPHRPRNTLIVPSEEEMNKLLAQPDTQRPIGIRDRTLMEVAYGCGLRRSELAGMTLADIDVDKATFRVRGKGKKERMVPLSKQALHWINVYLTEARPKLIKDKVDGKSMWVTTRGTHLDGGGMFQQVRHYVKKAGIRTPMNLHSLRKACATHMLSHGAHPAEIQALLGHANLSHLGQYLSVPMRELRQTHSQSKPGQ